MIESGQTVKVEHPFTHDLCRAASTHSRDYPRQDACASANSPATSRGRSTPAECKSRRDELSPVRQPFRASQPRHHLMPFVWAGGLGPGFDGCRREPPRTARDARRANGRRG